MKKIRRDDVGRRHQSSTEGASKNLSRERFLKSTPCASLTLLRHCAKLAENRKKLLDAKAPTFLLRLMLEVLNSIDESSSSNISNNSLIGTPRSKLQNVMSNEETPKKLHRIGSNPTSELLQELIETLASEISITSELNTNPAPENANHDAMLNEDGNEDEDYDESTLPMVLTSLTTTSLSPPLRKVIAKLLPFLTYGQISQSKALAQHFITHIDFTCLSKDAELGEDTLDSKEVLMDTFVDAAIHLPPVAVCNSLRSELMRQGFVASVLNFVLTDIPSTPPPWSAALFPRKSNENENTKNKKEKEQQWKNFYGRKGVQTGFKILIGLCKEHHETQSYVSTETINSSAPPFLSACHWLESTSDNSSSDISTNGYGILAETLLDTISENNKDCDTLVKRLRKQTRDRKKEMAQERRKKALVGMSAFGQLVGSGAMDLNKDNAKKNEVGSVSGVFSALSSVFTGRPKDSKDEKSDLKSDKINLDNKENSNKTKPSWMLEMEEMEDEAGLTCAVCQEGRTSQPTELLGLYAFTKKVAIPANKGGLKGSIDGALLLMSLPYALPGSLRGTDVEKEWFTPAKAAASALKETSHGTQTLSAASSSLLSSRPSYFITTVTAGNAIHSSCHARARNADRNHPKAPKSEWEGAALRNSRVTCNIILPLVSQKNSKIPVMSMETALADQQAACLNMLGVQRISMLWTVLHDVRLLLLRISYGESLSADCGGGSLTSNSSLIYYLLFLSDLFARDAEVDSAATVKHAKQLTSGFLAASSILRSDDYKDDSASSHRMRTGFVDAAPMASICCILFNDSIISSSDTSKTKTSISNTKKYWELYNEHFLCALVRCAGRRFALGISGSGCESTRGPTSSRSSRSSSFNEWDTDSKRRLTSSNANLEDYVNALRPMLTFYAIMNEISSAFVQNMEEEKVEECAERIVHVVGLCQKAENVNALLGVTNIKLDKSKILEEIIIGVKSANSK